MPNIQLYGAASQAVNRGVLTSTGATSGTGDTALFVSNSIPIGALVAGSALEVRLAGLSSSTGTLTFKVHIGPLGTVSDNAVITSLVSAAQASNTWTDVQALVVIRTATASGTAIGSITGSCNSHAGITNNTAAAGTVAVDCTVANLVTVSCACSTGTFTAELAHITQFA